MFWIVLIFIMVLNQTYTNCLWKEYFSHLAIRWERAWKTGNGWLSLCSRRTPPPGSLKNINLNFCFFYISVKYCHYFYFFKGFKLGLYDYYHRNFNWNDNKIYFKIWFDQWLHELPIINDIFYHLLFFILKYIMHTAYIC